MPLDSLNPDQRRIAVGLAAAGLVVLAVISAELIAPPPVGKGLAALSPRLAFGERLQASDPEALEEAFVRLGYTMDAVRQGAPVPRIILRRLPPGMDDVSHAAERKRLFLKAALPIVLRVNELIRSQRATLERLLERRKAGETLSGRERAWLVRLAAHYKTAPDRDAELLARVRPIPPSLALAQAATESGWGTSRFAQQGNALFGQWIYTDSEEHGLLPKARAAGKTHRVKAYERLIDSVWDYARNLNSNRAYRHFRKMRSEIARSGGRPAGAQLAASLSAYSQKGMAYVTLLRDVIRQNGLSRLDAARLKPRKTTVAGGVPANRTLSALPAEPPRL
jgi:Bax protein